jgi:hypothetical protein
MCSQQQASHTTITKLTLRGAFNDCTGNISFNISRFLRNAKSRARGRRKSCPQIKNTESTFGYIAKGMMRQAYSVRKMCWFIKQLCAQNLDDHSGSRSRDDQVSMLLLTPRHAKAKWNSFNFRKKYETLVQIFWLWAEGFIRNMKWNEQTFD